MTCMGTLPANAELWNTNPPTNNTTNYTYSATQTLLACRYKCNSGYTYDGEKCEKDGPINIKITCKQNKTDESWSSTTYTADKPVPFNIIIGQEILLYNNENGVRKFTTPQTIATYRITSGSTGSSKIAAEMAGNIGGSQKYVVGISSFASGVTDFNGKTRITNQSLKQTKDINGKEYIITLKDCAEPICGTNLENSYNTAPNPNYVALCDVGTASNVTTFGNNFTWTCSLPGVSPQSCYVKKNTYKCTGTLPANAKLWNTNTPTNNTTNYTYSATQTSLACRYKCIDDYYYSHLTNKCTKEGIDTLEPLDPKDCAFAKWDCLGVPNGSVPNCMVAGVPNGKCKCSPANARCYGGNVRYQD